MVPVKFTTGTGAPTWTLVGTFTDFWGVIATNAESGVYFLKIYWQGNSPTLPVVGTTVPSLTIPIQTAAPSWPGTSEALSQQGPMYYTVTKNAGDTDATALSTGGDVITLLVG